MEANNILKLASNIGKILLENGAEAYRVEETMEKICEAFHVEQAQAFVITTGVMLSITVEQKVYTNIIRVKSRGVNLQKIHELNELSRNIALYENFEAIIKKVEEIDQEPRYTKHITLLFSAFSAFGFAYFYQGSYRDAICACFAGFAIQTVSNFMKTLEVNDFFHHICSAATGALVALISMKLNLCDDKDIVIISSIMLLVPGLAITNAIRDTIAKDYLAGVTRAAEACIVAVGVAIGIVGVFTIWNTWLGGI